jgi:hypothetical protein
MLGRGSRFAPLSGLPFVALTVAGFASSNNTPNSDASDQRVIAFYQAHHSSPGRVTPDRPTPPARPLRRPAARRSTIA